PSPSGSDSGPADDPVSGGTDGLLDGLPTDGGTPSSPADDGVPTTPPDVTLPPLLPGLLPGLDMGGDSPDQ
ncbi:MAG TPA: hypothetical protein VIS29_19360, partial [Streptomyces sp.]